VEDARRELLADRLFYETGPVRGGVTVSGGEPLLQAEFVHELYSDLRKDGIHCAVDTCLNVPHGNVKTVLSATDLFLIDLKSFSSELHRKLTGAPNERILENIRFIADAGKKIEIRIPLVPGYNDSVENLTETAKFLTTLPEVPPVRLLPYHALARSKYEAVGRTDTMPHVPSPGRSALVRAASLMKEHGVKTIIIHGGKI